MEEEPMKKKPKLQRIASAPELVNASLTTSKRLTIYGTVVEIERKPLIKFQLKDRSGTVDVRIAPESANYFERVEIGDVFRGVALLRMENAYLFNHTDDLMQCVVWSGTGNDYNPKMQIFESKIPYDTKRIDSLRSLKLARNSSNLEQEIIDYKNSVYLAQACGQSIPAPSKRICNFVGNIAENCNVHKTETLNRLSDIYKKTDGLKNDNFFNIFAQVLSLHSCEDGGFVLRIWDGLDVSELAPLAKYNTMAIKHDLIIYQESKKVEEKTIDVVFYGKCWNEQLRNVKRKDIILLANLHINKRALGEYVLAMHENADDRRAAIVLPHDHFRANAINKIISKRSGEVSPIMSQFKRPSNNKVILNDKLSNDLMRLFAEQENRGIGALMDSQESTATWQPPISASQNPTQNLLKSQDVPPLADLQGVRNIPNLPIQIPTTDEPIDIEAQETEFSENEDYIIANPPSEVIEATTNNKEERSSAIELDIKPKLKKVRFDFQNKDIVIEVEPSSEGPECIFSIEQSKIQAPKPPALPCIRINTDDGYDEVPDEDAEVRDVVNLNPTENNEEMPEENHQLSETIIVEHCNSDNRQAAESVKQVGRKLGSVRNQEENLTVSSNKLRLLDLLRKRRAKEVNWEEEIAVLYRLQPKERYTFNRKLQFNFPLWKMLILSDRSNILVNSENESSKELHILVPLYSPKEELATLAISVIHLKQMYPTFKSLSEERCKQELEKLNISRAWMSEIYNDLKGVGFTSNEKMLASVNLYARFKDGIILLVDKLTEA